MCNGSDDGGRYDYKGQPGICRWNCEKLGESLGVIMPGGRVGRGLAAFDEAYAR